jgi:hypothetical protein
MFVLAAEVHIYHHLQPKAFHKFCPGNATVINISLHSHAVIRELSEDGKTNVLCLLKLQPNDEQDSCHFFCACSDEEVSGLNILGDAIQELCDGEIPFVCCGWVLLNITNMA